MRTGRDLRQWGTAILAATVISVFLLGGVACGKKGAPVPPEDAQPAKK
jgi:hypothetical protein